MAAVNRARTTYYRNTLPWGDSGERVLTVDNYLDTVAEMDQCRIQFEAAVNTFVDQDTYARFMMDGKQLLGDMWDIREYPNFSELRRKFAYDFAIMPMPQAEDFRCDIGDDEVAGIRQDIEKRVESASRAAFSDCFSRLFDAVQNMATKLNDPDARVHSATLENVKQLTQLLPKLNFYGDPDLTAAIEDARQLVTMPVEIVRENIEIRKAQGQKAQVLADRVKGWL